MKLNGSHLVAFAIMAGIGGWMLTGNLIVGGQVNPNKDTIADREAKRTTEAFRVRVTTLQPTERFSTLRVRGRTSADTLVGLRAETAGTVQARYFNKGDTVKPGDLVCVIDKGIRTTQLQQAKAKVLESDSEHKAAERLVERGFTTKTRLRQLKSALDASTAALAAAEQEISRTEVRATVTGIVQAPMAEVGDNLVPGGTCVTLMDSDPMLFTGQVSERDITDISMGMEANVVLLGGTEVSGKIRYISPTADPKTRTFTTEIELPNQDGVLRDGLTATAKIPLSPSLAYQLKASWLTLADDGQIGVRIVSDNDKVKFVPVKIVAQGKNDLWVEGLTPGVRLITLGQNYVTAGEVVNPIDAEKAAGTQSATSTHDSKADQGTAQ